MKKLLPVVFSLLVAPLVHAQGVVASPQAVAVRREQDKVWLGGSCDLIHKHNGVSFAVIGFTTGGTVAHPYHLDAILRDAIGDGHAPLEAIADKLGAGLNGPLQNALKVRYSVERPLYWRLRRPLLEILIVKGERAYIARWAAVQAGTAPPYATPSDTRFLEHGAQGGIGAVPRTISIGTDLRDGYAACPKAD